MVTDLKRGFIWLEEGFLSLWAIQTGISPNRREWWADYPVSGSTSSIPLSCQKSLWPSFCHSTIFLLPSRICSALHLWDLYDYKMTWGKLGKNLLHITEKRYCTSWSKVIWQSPNHWNVLGTLLDTTKMEEWHHAHMTLQIYSQNWWSNSHE